MMQQQNPQYPQQQVPQHNMHATQVPQQQMPQGQQMVTQYPQQAPQQPAHPPTPQGWGGNPTGETPTIKFKELPIQTQVLGTLKQVQFTDSVYQNQYKGRQIIISVQVDVGPQEMLGKTHTVYLTGSKYTDFLALGIAVGDGWGFNYFGEVKTAKGLPMQKIGQLCEKRTNTPPVNDPEFGKTVEEYYASKMGMAQNMNQVMPQNQVTPQTQPNVQVSTNMPPQQQQQMTPQQQMPQQQPQTSPEIPNFFPQQNGGIQNV